MNTDPLYVFGLFLWLSGLWILTILLDVLLNKTQRWQEKELLRKKEDMDRELSS